MSYRNSINLNRLQYDDAAREKEDNYTQIISQKKKIISYIYVTNISTYSPANGGQFLFPDGEFTFQIGRSITPKYFKLEFIILPNTVYQQSNTRKKDTRNLGNPLIEQYAPLKMVWREWDGVNPVQTFILDLEPGNYTTDEIIKAIEDLMNTSPNNQYKLTLNETTMRLETNVISGTHQYAYWFSTFQENADYTTKNKEQLVSEYMGYSVIPLVDEFETGKKVSPLVMDVSNSSIILMEILGTPAILNQSSFNDSIQSTFNATFIINYYGNRGDYSLFTVNKDFQNEVTMSNKITFDNMTIRLRDFVTGDIMHFNGSTPYMVLSYEEYGIHENFNN